MNSPHLHLLLWVWNVPYSPRVAHTDCLFLITSSLFHVATSTYPCLEIVRLHPQPCFPKKEKFPCLSNLFMVQSIYLHNTPNQGKSSTHLLRQVTSLQLNIYNDCDQCTHTPQMSQKTVQSAPSQIIHLKELPCIGTFEPIILPTSTNDPPKSISHHTMIHKSAMYIIPHLMSHSKGKRTLPKSLSLYSSHSGWLATILGQILCWLHPSPRKKLHCSSTSFQNMALSPWLFKSLHDPKNMAKAPMH
jgi:hypothetical protein